MSIDDSDHERTIETDMGEPEHSYPFTEMPSRELAPQANSWPKEVAPDLQPQDPKTLARRLFRQMSPFQLPLPIFLAAEDGLLLEGNQCLRDALALTHDQPFDFKIADLCFDSSGKKELQKRFQKARVCGRYDSDQPIRLCVAGQERYFRTTIGALKESTSDPVVGYLGCLLDTTEQEQYYELYEHLAVGVYRLDSEDRIVAANSALVEILGYRTSTEIVGRPARDFYSNPNEADAFRAHVEQEGTLVNEVKELVRKDGQRIFASISSVAIKDAHGRYQGRECTLLDVTREELYRRSLDDVPMGFYEVRREGTRDVIRQFNRHFLEMFRFESPGAADGFDIRDLYCRSADYYEFRNQILARDRHGLPLLGYPLRVRTRTGEELTIEVNSRILRDRDGKEVGRTGIVRDITEEHRLRSEIATLQNDIGQVLHTYTSVLVMIRHKVLPALASLGPDPFDRLRLPSPFEIDQQLEEPVSQLTASLAQLTSSLEVDPDRRGISREDWDRLETLTKALLTHRQISPLEFRPPTLDLYAREILALCRTTLRDKLPQPAVDAVLRDAGEVGRLTALIALRQIEAEAIEMDHQIRALRDYVTTGARAGEPKGIFLLSDLVRQTVGNLDEFANVRRVTIQYKDVSRGARVAVVQRDVLRALGNLLHNAIKYSWSRQKGAPAWVDVRAIAMADRVLVEFENFGVPIPRDELETGLVFNLGYRGRLSTDRGRLGTGIGLTDALNVARRHGGSVKITSNPASPGSPPDRLDVPHVTTATFELPRYRPAEETNDK